MLQPHSPRCWAAEQTPAVIPGVRRAYLAEKATGKPRSRSACRAVPELCPSPGARGAGELPPGALPGLLCWEGGGCRFLG